jgi:hypothetical protein
MEYERQRGSFDDLPYEQLLHEFAEIYGTTFGDVSEVGSAAEAGDDAFA